MGPGIENRQRPESEPGYAAPPGGAMGLAERRGGPPLDHRQSVSRRAMGLRGAQPGVVCRRPDAAPDDALQPAGEKVSIRSWSQEQSGHDRASPRRAGTETARVGA